MGVRAAVAIGGAVGAVGRVAVAEALPTAAGSLPWATLLVNVSGALALGCLAAWAGATDQRPDPRLVAGIGTGVLGAWTTFSTLAVELDELLRERPTAALLYVVLTVAGGYAAAVAGRHLVVHRSGVAR